MEEVCRLATVFNTVVVLPGVWEGPRLDGTCFHTTAVITPTVQPPSTVAGSPGGAAGVGAGAAATPATASVLVDVCEAVALCHSRTVIDEAQVPGVFPSCCPSAVGALGILPDADIMNGSFVQEVVDVRATSSDRVFLAGFGID